MEPVWQWLGDWAFGLLKIISLGIAFGISWSLRNAFIAGWNIHKFIADFQQYKIDNEKALAEIREKALRDIPRDFEGEIEDLRASVLERFAIIDRRLEKAGGEMSQLATYVQGLPERMRESFVPKREIELQFKENQIDRELLRTEVNNLWKRVNERDERSRR